MSLNTRAILLLSMLTAALVGGPLRPRPEESTSDYSPRNAFLSRPDTTRFHSYARMMHEVDSLVVRYPGIASVETLAVTPTAHRAVVAVCLTNRLVPDSGRPAILFNGVHHGCEFIGTEICLAMLDSLLQNSGQPAVRRWLDSLRIFIVPMVNPDGHEVNVSGADTWWRKNTRDNDSDGYFDSRDGVDLNRNYPFNWEIGGGTDPAEREYRGPYPLSEGEARGVAGLTEREKLLMDICWHSDQDYTQGEKVYYPWLWGSVHSPDYSFIRPIAESVAASIVNDSGTGTYQAAVGYAASGGMYRNWSYYDRGVFSFTIEVGHGYYPAADRVDSICNRVLVGAWYALNRMLGAGIHGRVRDSLTGLALTAEVTMLETDTNNAEPILPRRSDSLNGRFYRLVTQGDYHFMVSCPGYQSKTVGPVHVSAAGPIQLDVRLSPIMPGWRELAPMPSGLSNRAVRSGGWLVYMTGPGMVYAARGNRTGDFYSFSMRNGAWKSLESIPRGTEHKPPSKGAKGVADGTRFIYAVKGNNSPGFWRYDILGDTWHQLADVPLLPDGKKVKGGGDLAYVPKAGGDCVYLLKGYRNSFFRYDVATDQWNPMSDAPGAATKWKDGSWLVSDGNHRVYAHKSNYHEFFRYDAMVDSWNSVVLTPMPLTGNSGHARKSKDGGCATFGADRIYALKGGNTQELWCYSVGGDHWTELDTIPGLGSTGRRRRVKDGAAIADPGSGTLLALKGNNTNELWYYVAPRSPGDGSVSHVLSRRQEPLPSGPDLHVAPSLFHTRTIVRYWLTSPGSINLRIYEVTGKLVMTLTAGPRPTGFSEFRLERSGLPSGVYLLRLETGSGSVTQKLILD